MVSVALRIFGSFLFIPLALLGPSWATADDFSLAGGDTTVDDRGPLAFKHEAANLTGAESAAHDTGDEIFDQHFVDTSGSSPQGLGPKFNNVSCGSCHMNDGRGPMNFGPEASTAIVRISLAHGKAVLISGTAPVPGIGTQLRDHASSGLPIDAKIELTWIKRAGLYQDGTPYNLRKPHLKILDARNRPLSGAILTSLRSSPPVFGLGLLEAVPAETLVAQQQQNSLRPDGIRGHMNMVWDAVARQFAPGRFGLKANTPSLVQQAAGAFASDMGVSNPVFPGEDGSTDIVADTLRAVEFYTQTIGVPRSSSQEDLIGQGGALLFAKAKCSVCHIPTLQSGPATVAALAFQTFHPFTDLLVHDMGPDLSDNRADFLATGREWRTAPLWGIGLTKTVGGENVGFLHDGRARNLEEAILWHGGEAAESKHFFKHLTKDERASLIAFLNSL